jgi:GTPase SAR1 family protein
MWSDNETTLDLLGFQVHADLIRSVVTDPKLLPITIGVFGDWGSGKSSIMKMLQHDLEADNYSKESADYAQLKGVACLYFNGWLFEGYDDAKSALLSSVLTELSEHKNFGPKIKEKATKLLRSVDWMRLARFGFKEVAFPTALAFITGGASILPTLIASGKKVLDQFQPNPTDPNAKEPVNLEEFLKANENADVPMDVRTFRDRFTQLLKESDITSLVILIDDLDRCTPQRIIDNLEAIKLFLSVDNTAFVIGADPRIVRHAISTIYRPDEIQNRTGEGDPTSDLVKDYLEKLIQVPYHLPRLSPAEVETYMSLLFCFQDLEKDAFTRVHTALGQHREKDRYSVFSYGAINSALEGGLSEALQQSLSLCNIAAPLITEGLKGNPRQVKRFLNALILRKKLAQVARLSHIQDSVLIKLMILEYTYPESFNTLYRWQAAENGFPKQIQQLEQAISRGDGTADKTTVKNVDQDQEWNQPFHRKWIAMEPKLSDTDLRDYFWIARDRLQSTLSDVSLVPPIIRQIVNDLVSDHPGQQRAATETAIQLHSEELDLLYRLLTQQLGRKPADMVGYTAFRLLIEANLAGSAPAYAKALANLAPASINPAAVIQIRTLLRAKPELVSTFEPFISSLKQQPETKAGRAYHPAKGKT